MQGFLYRLGRRGVGGLRRGVVVLCLEPILVWRWCVAPVLGPRCRFTPSCSQYAEEALCRHGVLRGGGLVVWRLLRCTGLSKGGADPVPAVFSVVPVAVSCVSPVPVVQTDGETLTEKTPTGVQARAQSKTQSETRSERQSGADDG